MSYPLLVLVAAAIAGGLVVDLFHALKPAAFDEPADVLVGGVSLQQVAGAGGTRPRVLIELGALVACLIFLAGSIPTLF